MGQTISTAVDIACYLKAISTAKTQYWVINRGSNMSGHSILNLLNELVKLILCEALPSTISVLPTSLINSVLNEHEC